MTPPTATKSELDAAALDRAFDTESADEGAARLAQDTSLRAELEAARAAAAEEAERPLEESYVQYLDPKTVPPAQRVRMPSQKLYVNEAVAFPQRGIPTVRSMRPVIEPPPAAPVIEPPPVAPIIEPPAAPVIEPPPVAPVIEPPPALVEMPAAIPATPQASSRLVFGVAAGLVAIGAASWLALRDTSAIRVEPSAATPAASSAPLTPAPEAATARTTKPVASPPGVESSPVSVPAGSGAPSAPPSASSSAKPGRNPANFGGMQF